MVSMNDALEIEMILTGYGLSVFLSKSNKSLIFGTRNQSNEGGNLFFHKICINNFCL